MALPGAPAGTAHARERDQVRPPGHGPSGEPGEPRPVRSPGPRHPGDVSREHSGLFIAGHCPGFRGVREGRDRGPAGRVLDGIFSTFQSRVFSVTRPLLVIVVRRFRTSVRGAERAPGSSALSPAERLSGDIHSPAINATRGCPGPRVRCQGVLGIPSRPSPRQGQGQGQGGGLGGARGAPWGRPPAASFSWTARGPGRGVRVRDFVLRATKSASGSVAPRRPRAGTARRGARSRGVAPSGRSPGSPRPPGGLSGWLSTPRPSPCQGPRVRV